MGPSNKKKSQIGPSFIHCSITPSNHFHFMYFFIKNITKLLGQVCSSTEDLDFQGAFFLHLYQYKKGSKGTKNLWHFFAHSVLGIEGKKNTPPQAKKVWRVYTQKVIIMVMPTTSECPSTFRRLLPIITSLSDSKHSKRQLASIWRAS